MRILHTISELSSGGQDYRTADEARWLVRNGHEAWIACNPESELFERAAREGIPVIPLQMRSTWDYAATARLLRLIGKLRCDLVHTHSPIDAWIALPLKFSGVPVVRSRHNTNPVRKAFFSTFSYRYGCDHLIATAECIRTAFIRDNRIPPARLSVIGEGVETSRFHPLRDGSRFRKRWGIRPGEVAIGCIGMFRPEKGQKQFIQAAALARKKIPEARFIMIGDHKKGRSPFRERYRNLARKRFGYDAWLPENAILAGPETPFLMHGLEPEIASATAALDISVIPSLAEAQSRTAPEAMCMGKAVIASEVGGLPEVVEHQRTGLLVAPGDVDALAEAMIRLTLDPELRERLGRTAFERMSAGVSMDVKMRETLAIYEQVLRARKSVASL